MTSHHSKLLSPSKPERPFRRTAWALLVTLLLTACATAPPPTPQPPSALEQARSAYQQGDWSTAASRYNALAEGSDSDASALWLRAADAWWQAGDTERSAAALEQVMSTALNLQEQALESLLRGESALAAGDLEAATFYLGAALEHLPGTQMSRLMTAQRTLQELSADPAAMTLAQVEETITTLPPGDREAARALVEKLQQLTDQRLRQEADAPSPLGQWAALSLSLRDTLVQQNDTTLAAQEWQQRFPLHPINAEGYETLAWELGRQLTPPARIAVLLPESGSLSAAGSAIRDGMLAAYLDRPASSELVFLPVAADSESAVNAYAQASADGFDWMIGPLRRESAWAITEQADPRLQGLLLNTPQAPAAPAAEPVAVDPLPPTPVAETHSDGVAQAQPVTQPPMNPAAASEFLSISLSQENEAQAVAQRMLDQGLTRVILLLSDSAWGERVENAFIEHFLEADGQIIAIERFDDRQADHSTELTRLLQIEDARLRRRGLQNALGIPLEFEDARRDDFDAFFLAASPALGRQLKPQLRFFDAGEKPVYAMSRVFAGRPNPSLDADLNGVTIPTGRWVIALNTDSDETALRQLRSLRQGAFTSLHALGRDAWSVTPWLPLMRRDPTFRFPGASGDLRLNQDGQLIVEPLWGEFRRGLVAPAMTVADPR